MKKINFIISIALLVYCNIANAQQITLNKDVNINLPKNTQKITKEEALQHVTKTFNNDKILYNSISRRRFDNVYKINNVLISLFTDNQKVNGDHLYLTKKGFDELFKENHTYSATLKSVNDYSALIINYSLVNVYYYRLFCYNKDNSKAVTGILEYNQSDAIQAKTILDELIKGIRFAN
jgi:hypothetical protein